LPLLSFYKENVFPIARAHGLVPVSADEIISPEDALLARTLALYERAGAILWDFDSLQVPPELEAVLLSQGGKPIAVVLAALPVPSALPSSQARIILRPSAVLLETLESQEMQAFLATIENWLADAAQKLSNLLEDEPRRLLEKNEYNAAVIASISLLEASLREYTTRSGLRTETRGGLMNWLRLPSLQGSLESHVIEEVRRWLNLRNEIAHGNRKATRQEAITVVEGVSRILRELEL
jgi:hypothetical protein